MLALIDPLFTSLLARLGVDINVPLPPGSGDGAFRDVIDRIVAPAFLAYQPELILISSGFDASAMDPLGRQMATSETYRYMTKVMMEVAEKTCGGKLVMVHEGGYSPQYVPWCGLATVEQMSGLSSGAVDPFHHGWFLGSLFFLLSF